MGLSTFQKFAIAGGEAAKIVRETERNQMDGIKNALFKSIEDSVAPAAESVTSSFEDDVFIKPIFSNWE